MRFSQTRTKELISSWKEKARPMRSPFPYFTYLSRKRATFVSIFTILWAYMSNLEIFQWWFCTILRITDIWACCSSTLLNNFINWSTYTLYLTIQYKNKYFGINNLRTFLEPLGLTKRILKDPYLSSKGK